MKPEDLNYLRAELLMARQAGTKKVMISTADLQSLIDQVDNAQEKIDRSDESKFKRCGFIIGDNLRNLIEGEEMFAKIKRKKSPLHSTQIYFKEIEGSDGREKHAEQKTIVNQE